jgi:predicted ATPase
VGPFFPGTFEVYVASIISHWQSTGEIRLQQLASNLIQLGLTNRIDARKVNDVQFEIRVGQLPLLNAREGQPMINIADVGLGVSQVLPVLVALLVAEPGQMVYIEQPEIHLHPRAQAALAKVLADAANRGVRVVVETHSSLLLTAIQTCVARGEIAPSEVMLHWFQRDESGVTQIASTEPDEAGAFGDWPEDFADVALEVESRYLDAAEARLMG